MLGTLCCHSCSFFTRQVGNLSCSKAWWKRPVCSVTFYNMGKWGLFVASAEYPSWSIHTDTSDILRILKALVRSFPLSYGKSREAINYTGRWLLGSMWELATPPLCRWSWLDGPESKKKRNISYISFAAWWEKLFLCDCRRRQFKNNSKIAPHFPTEPGY